MNINPSPRIRLVLYVLIGLVNLVMAYLVTKGKVGVDEVTLVNGISALVAGLAAINVDTSGR